MFENNLLAFCSKMLRSIRVPTVMPLRFGHGIVPSTSACKPSQGPWSASKKGTSKVKPTYLWALEFHVPLPTLPCVSISRTAIFRPSSCWMHQVAHWGKSPSLQLQWNAQSNAVWNSTDFPTKGSLSGNTKGVLQSQIPCVHLVEPTSSQSALPQPSQRMGYLKSFLSLTPWKSCLHKLVDHPKAYVALLHPTIPAGTPHLSFPGRQAKPLQDSSILEPCKAKIP